MILAETLTALTTYTAASLTSAIQKSGYKTDKFEWACFLGMTNSLQFCYEAHFRDSVTELGKIKVFLSYDPITGKVSADY